MNYFNLDTPQIIMASECTKDAAPSIVPPMQRLNDLLSRKDSKKLPRTFLDITYASDVLVFNITRLQASEINTTKHFLLNCINQ